MTADRGTVLLVEDRESSRLTLTALLEDEGFEVQPAASFAEALLAVGSTSAYAAVLLDRDLGDGDGLDLVASIRAAHPAAKIVLLSGAVVDAAAVDAVVSKGESFDALLERLDSLLGMNGGSRA
jgi:two-component system, response regulator RegA